jgi:hypothetical protein
MNRSGGEQKRFRIPDLSHLYQWIDVGSKGVFGTLAEQARVLFYKCNLSNAKFAFAQHLTTLLSLADLQSGTALVFADVTQSASGFLKSVGRAFLINYEKCACL